MELNGLPLMVIPTPAVTLTLDLIMCTYVTGF